MANLEDTYLPVRSVTPSKQSTAAVASPLVHSVSSAQSSASSATPNSDRHRLEGISKASFVGMIPQPTESAGAGETASTSEVSYSECLCSLAYK